jgi:simple sugar transport system ATP-binding protein
MSTPPLVALHGIRKFFGDLLVNDHVDLDVRPGEVHALLGENGAGKTTLMRILYGLTSADGGRIEVDGRPVSITSPSEAIALGIGMVTQHFALVRPMTVLENVMLTSAGLGRLDTSAARARLATAAGHLGVPVEADARIENLSVGEQQRVEIAKCLYQGARMLILDEPTAVLVPQDVAALFEALRRLVADGMGVLFVSHKLHEVAQISDRVSVLRHGRIVDSRPTGTASAAELAELMVGRSVAAVLREERRVDDQPGPQQGGAAVIVLDGVRLDGPDKPILDDVDLQVHAGEIVAVAGVSGNGQRELAEVLFGLRAPSRGRIRLGEHDLTGATPSQVVAAGLGRIPEDRHGSVVTELSVEENLVLEDLAGYRRGPFLDRRAVRAHAVRLIEEYAIKASPTDRMGSLSGGTMQKVLLARVLSRNPRAVVVAQPTRGLDVGAGEYVHTQLLARRAAGAALLMISEDLDEILALADRIAVMFEGRVMAVLDAATADRARLGLLMAGVETPAREAP